MSVEQKKTDLSQMPCTSLKGVGEKVAEKLARCDIHTVQDLLFHLPLHYQDRTHIAPIANLRIGDTVCIEGTVTHTDIVKGKRPTLLVHLQDGTGTLYLRFFYFGATYQKVFETGNRIRCFGEVRNSRLGKELIHPEYQRFFANHIRPVEETLTPVYPTTEGLSQKVLRHLTDQALVLLHEKAGLQEYLPKELLDLFRLSPLKEALQYVHRPPPDAQLTQLEQGTHPAQRRLAFEELLAHRLSLLGLRDQNQSLEAPPMQKAKYLEDQFLLGWSYALTNAQKRVVEEIKNDLYQAKPMLRLMQGDVGSGKTIVAFLAMLNAVENGFQSALMVPTELLAEQHYSNFKLWLKDLNIQVTWLAGKHKGKMRTEILEEIVSGKSTMVIGTHSLFQEGVAFHKLALVIIDEQHRFGVHQRLALREKGAQQGMIPHQLILTATPIPRTLAMTAYADLDISILDELPPGRKIIKTVVVPNHKRNQVVDRVREACLQKRQCYWVCPLIEESEVLSCQAAEVSYTQLTQQLPELRIGLVHGRTKSNVREEIMNAFKKGELDLLVATTVIEVGVDVPNASLIIIENAERLGLAQLHQLRGRVGRGTQESYCILLYQAPLSHHAKERLAILRNSNDGFVIAQKDLELRGPGEFLGTRQTGTLKFRIADLIRDQDLLPEVDKAATSMLQKYKSTIPALVARWSSKDERYAHV